MDKFDLQSLIIDVAYDSEDRFYTSKWNLQEDVAGEISLPQKISFVDSTLREGAETPFVHFSREQKAEIVAALQEVGVTEFDCGLVTHSADHAENLQVTKQYGAKAMAIVRLDVGSPEEEIKKAVDAGADVLELSLYGAPVPGFRSPNDYCNLVERCAAHAKGFGVIGAFWVPGAHWNPEFVLDLYASAIRGGADRVDIAGTGCLSPTATKAMIRKLKKIAGDKSVGLHCHNHYGVATACAIGGVEAGADVIHTSINGMSDGAGLAAFDEVVMCLHSFYGMDLKIDLSKLTGLARKIENLSGQRVHGWKPIVGPNVFTETPDSHLELILRERKSRSEGADRGRWVIVGMKPEAVGQEVNLIFGYESLGGRGVRAKAELMGRDLDEETLSGILGDMRNRIDANGPLSEADVERLIEAKTA